MPFAESPYEMPPAIAPLEAAGRQGYMVLIEGKQTGSARLSVHVSHPAYSVSCCDYSFISSNGLAILLFLYLLTRA